MAKSVGHWDAWGHPILSYFEMHGWYSKDQQALETLRNNLPCNYIVIPDIFIYVYKNSPQTIKVRLVYPGHSNDYERILPERGVKALRRLFVNCRSGWLCRQTKTEVIFTRKGTLVKAPYSKFGFLPEQ